jgi:hypothetical protein
MTLSGLRFLDKSALGDKRYHSKSNREAARQRGICPAISHRSNANDMPGFIKHELHPTQIAALEARGDREAGAGV